MKHLFLFAAVCLVAIGSSLTSQEAPKPKDAPPAKKYPRGRKAPTPEFLAARHAAAFQRHAHRMKALPAATPATFDCGAVFGNVLPINDQGQCGSCYLVSSADVCSMALAKGGYGKPDGSFRLSSQFGLDCQNFGGCDGGDEAEVIDYIKKNGFPLTGDYGPYRASPARCKSTSGMKLWTIADWGYCTPSQQSGMASTQDIKNAMVRYGPISIAFDAAGCDSYTGGVMKGRGNNVDHAVILTGWDDSKHAWRLMNQWGTSWGEGGFAWIDYDSYSVGTEAIWVSVTQLPPPPGPTPPPVPPPGPTPVPPTPGVSITGVTLTNSDGTATTLQVVPAGSVTLDSSMKLPEILEAIQKAAKGPTAAPCCQPPTAPANDAVVLQRIERMEAVVDRLEKILNGQKK